MFGKMHLQVGVVVLVLLLLVLILPVFVAQTSKAGANMRHGQVAKLPDGLMSGNVWVPRACVLKPNGNLYGLSNPERVVAEGGDQLAFGDFTGGIYCRDYQLTGEQIREIYLGAVFSLRDLESGKVLRLTQDCLLHNGQYLVFKEKVEAGKVYRFTVTNKGESRSWDFQVGP